MTDENMSGMFKIPCPDFELIAGYSRYYSEEIIWKYAKRVLELNRRTRGLQCYVIVMSHNNHKDRKDRNVHLWKQKVPRVDITCRPNIKMREGLDFWKHHVFLITEYRNVVLVHDFSSTLEFPTDFSIFASEALGHDFDIPRYFKCITAQTYVDKFSSDRGHMISETGDWIVEPPPYEPILNAEGTSNFAKLIDMRKNKNDEFGTVLTLKQFLHRFNPESQK